MDNTSINAKELSSNIIDYSLGVNKTVIIRQSQDGKGTMDSRFCSFKKSSTDASSTDQPDDGGRN